MIIATEVKGRHKTSKSFSVSLVSLYFNETTQQWQDLQTMLNKSMNLDKGADIYSKEVYQNEMAWVSNINKYNQYFSIFGEFQMVIEYLGQNAFCNFNSF